MNTGNSVAIIGAGALGSYYASKFSGLDQIQLSLIAGGEHYDRLTSEGVTVNGQNFRPKVIKPEESSSPDLIIVAVKHHHLDQAIEDIKNHVGKKTQVLSAMNGIDSEERLAAVYGWDNVLFGSALGIDALRHDNNEVTYTREGVLYVGEARYRPGSRRVEEVFKLLDAAGIPIDVPEDMMRLLWWKFMINVGINQVSAVLKAPYGVFQQSVEARELMRSAMNEVLALAKVQEINIREDDLDEWETVLQSLSPQGQTSMCQDVVAHRRTEVDMLAGKVVELGRELGVETPVNLNLLRFLKVMEHHYDSLG